MTTKEYIKLLVIAAGYPMNIKVESDRQGIDTIYSVYAESIDCTDDNEEDIDLFDNKVLSIHDCCLLDLIGQIINASNGKYPYQINHFSNKMLLDDTLRDEYLREDYKRRKLIKTELKLMKPVDEYITSNDPCNKAPNCEGEFDDSDTCHGFWKCTHQYHNNCELKHKYREFSQKLRQIYRKYAHNEELKDNELNKLKQYNLYHEN